MIGTWLARLTNEQLSDIVTHKMGPGALVNDDGSRCLVGVVGDYYYGAVDMIHKRRFPCPHVNDSYRNWGPRHMISIPSQYDTLCERFGTMRVNAAIRHRAIRLLSFQHGFSPPSLSQPFSPAFSLKTEVRAALVTP